MYASAVEIHISLMNFLFKAVCNKMSHCPFRRKLSFGLLQSGIEKKKNQESGTQWNTGEFGVRCQTYCAEN
jgi:hypothetical protein